MTVPKVCSRQSHKKNPNPEAEYFKAKIKYDFNKEVLMLDDNGSLHIYKGDFPLISFLNDLDLPKLIPEISGKSNKMITGLSNPKNSRVTLHLNTGEAHRIDFQFKGKLRDLVIQTSIEVMKHILPMETFCKFYEHLLYVLFIPHPEANLSTASSWKIFTELFFVLLDKRIEDSSHSSGQIEKKISAFEKMLGSKTGAKLLKGLKPSLPNKLKYAQQVHEQFDSSLLFLKRFMNNITAEDMRNFQECSEDLFKVFHLMNEELKLNVFHTKSVEEGNLIDFLFRF